MEKLKLQKARNKKGLSQQEIAVLANMDQTTYGRKEKGISKITSMEWKRFASILDLPLKEIFEDDDKSVVINNDNSTNSIVMSNNNEYYSVPDVLESLRNYIQKLESENKSKEKEIIALKAKLQRKG